MTKTEQNLQNRRFQIPELIGILQPLVSVRELSVKESSEIIQDFKEGNMYPLRKLHKSLQEKKLNAVAERLLNFIEKNI